MLRSGTARGIPGLPRYLGDTGEISGRAGLGFNNSEGVLRPRTTAGGVSRISKGLTKNTLRTKYLAYCPDAPCIRTEGPEGNRAKEYLDVT